MVVGRDTELDALDELFADLIAGRGRALVVRGEPGVGKTALLEAAIERCPAGVTVLRARGVESEAELAFSALRDLLGPVADARAVLPAPQAAALAAALVIGPPQPGERFAVCVATLGVLRAVAERRPVLVVVDDAHWLDVPSSECLHYAARRSHGPVAFVLATRDADPEPALPTLSLGPLARPDALALLKRVAPDLVAPVAAALADAAAGSPLALVELPATLDAGQRAGRAPLELPLAPGGRVQAAFGARLADLSAEARCALLVAALYEGNDLTTIATAAAQAGTDARLLAPAETAGLVRIDGERLAFNHPLVRGAVRGAATPAERRAAHRALAGAVDGERRAWHLAASTIGTDEAVAAELEQAAGAAAARRGFASAAAAAERAARLSPAGAGRARRLLLAGETAGAAGMPDRAEALLAEAARATVDEPLRARAHHRRGLVMLWSGAVEAAIALLVAEADRVAPHAPGQAAAMLADAAAACTAASGNRNALALAERAAALLPDGVAGELRAHVLAIHGYVLVLRGQTRRASPLLAEAARLGADVDELAPGAQWKHLLLRMRLPADDLEGARAESLRLCERARAAGALAALGGALVVSADAAWRLGDWDAADAAAREAIRVAEDTGNDVWRGLALAVRARLTAARGEEEASRRAAAAALALAETSSMSSGRRYAHGAVGFLELGLGRVTAAIAELETVERVSTELGVEEPTTVPWTPDLVEAYARAGRDADARRVCATLARQVETSGSSCAAAALARCRGLLSDDFDTAFAEALALEVQPFERGRTLLCLGLRQRRASRRTEARERLREAQEVFARLGAAAWEAQASHELRAAGGRRAVARAETLTAQERRVAAAVLRGASNREIAAELFLAEKTIEFHLRQVYRKLGVRSRTQLVVRLGRQGFP